MANMGTSSLNPRNILSACLVGATFLATVESSSVRAQSTSGDSSTRTNIPASVLAEIREAPFSQIFDLGDSRAFAIKDQDYKASEPDIGVFSLWADVPELDRLALAVKYCLEDTSIAR
ncbi:MAG: hypothetical protein AAFW95_14630, partial [Cyanobacteria bacterium J06638_6]